MATLRRINQKNQLTLPEAWVEEIGVHKGDFLMLTREGHTIHLTPVEVQEPIELSEKEWKRVHRLITQQLRGADSFETPVDAGRLLRKHMKRK